MGQSAMFTTFQRLNTDDQAWLVGLIEGDGWFTVSRNSLYAKLEFGISLHKKDIQLLYKIKSMLGVGSISERSNRDMATFKIAKKQHLKDHIVPIFDKYPM